MAKKKFYAVRKGHNPGIYKSWPSTEAQVKGYAGAQFKGFVEEEEARRWLEGDMPLQQKRKNSSKKQSPVEEHILEKVDIAIYTDGGAINNPGPGGYGVVLKYKGMQRELSGGYRLTTNNRMELMACIVALREVQGDTGKMALFSDSSYVVNGISKGWVKNWKRNGWIKSDKKPVLNRDLWEELFLLYEGFDIKFQWVKGHAGNFLNERCDELAVKSARSDGLPADLEYERNQRK